MDFDNSFFVMQLCVSTFNSRAVYFQQDPDGKVTRGETMNSRKNKEKHGFGGFWNEISPESNSPQLPEHLSRISDGIFTQTRYVDASTELGESIGSG